MVIRQIGKAIFSGVKDALFVSVKKEITEEVKKLHTAEVKKQIVPIKEKIEAISKTLSPKSKLKESVNELVFDIYDLLDDGKLNQSHLTYDEQKLEQIRRVSSYVFAAIVGAIITSIALGNFDLFELAMSLLGQ